MTLTTDVIVRTEPRLNVMTTCPTSADSATGATCAQSQLFLGHRVSLQLAMSVAED